MPMRLAALSSLLLRCLAVALAFAVSPVHAGEGRVALVIGNEAYENAPPLATPVRDAQDMARALRDLGFDVTVLTDANPDVFKAVLGAFAAKAAGADTALFYYSGHAFQQGGLNRLVPVSARLDDPAKLADETLALNEIATAIRPKDGQLLIFLDACRTNPLPDAPQDAGLAQYDAGSGSFVAFATAPGQVAWDKGADGANSPFTGALLRHVAEPGQSLSDLMILVRNDVSDQTGGKQIPWEQSSLRSQFRFAPAGQPATEATAPSFDAPSFDTVDADTVLLDDTALAEADPVRLAALSSETRSLATVAPVSPDAPRIAGSDVAPGGVALPENLPEGVQQELKRVGCYSGKVDGDWGNGSRRALGRYFDAVKSDSKETEPTAEVFVALTKAAEKTCKPQPVAAKPATKKSGTSAKKSAPDTTKSNGNTTKKQAPAQAAPAPAPEKKGPRCKFLVVAVVCS
ncbi:caspase family protein [Tabrizicola sp. KVB23]|uniref:Caspase family protein n=2 Tax=Fuscibacter oryzae TaxID=2803939 RepID=A0A8J7MQ98_9RHOB|nr:caspase family protein [Fuscibacter oryzae]